MDPKGQLEKRLNKAKSYEKPEILKGAYNQLMEFSNGEYRNYAEFVSYSKGKDLANYVASELEKNGLKMHAKKLRDHYFNAPLKDEGEPVRWKYSQDMDVKTEDF